MQEHHSRITPELDRQTPERDLADAWRLRRSKYVRWLEDPETFFLVAEDEGGPVDDMAITTTKTNVDSHRFYERQGFSQAFVVYHGKRPHS